MGVVLGVYVYVVYVYIHVDNIFYGLYTYRYRVVEEPEFGGQKIGDKTILLGIRRKGSGFRCWCLARGCRS